ncbi:hypothetical protein [Mesorhizobium sp. ANAO-SY3R2]|uniref:hypothetical protein n=1 Tax=Mesorhizobium sp. ANAO-SY3R2 TaxID=3166644 RepID=UPI00366C87FD
MAETVFEWLDDLARDFEQGTVGGFSPELGEKMAAWGAEASNPEHFATLDSILQFVGVAHGLHAAAAKARAMNEYKWAGELHSMGQLFLSHAAGGIETFAFGAAAAATIKEGEGATKH